MERLTQLLPQLGSVHDRVAGLVVIEVDEDVVTVLPVGIDSLSPAPELRAALAVDGPAVVSIECAADEIPPFAAFLTSKTVTHEDRTDVAASA